MDFEQAMCHQPSLGIPRAGTELTVHRPLQVSLAEVERLEIIEFH